MITQDDLEHAGVQTLDNQLCFALYSASRAMTAAYRPLLSPLGLTYPQYLVMLVLWQAEAESRPVNVSQLGERLMLEAATLTPLLKRMEVAGLLTRQRGEQDQRIVWLKPTPAGLALADKTRHIPLQMLCQLPLPLEQLIALRDQLQHLTGGLQHCSPHATAETA